MSGELAKGFLADIVANIDDDTPRLAYADWLMENGQDDRAEFIRVQVRLARLPAWDGERLRLRLREQQLLEAHGEEWLAEMPKIKGVRWEAFRRGIVAGVWFDSFEVMRSKAAACRAVAPVEAVTVHWPRRKESKKADHPIAELRELTLTGRPFDKEIDWLADSPQLSTLRVLSVLGLDRGDLSRLAASPHLTGLRVLRLVSNGLGTAGVEALTRAATLTNLEELDLTGPGHYEQYYDDPIIDAAGLETLADWPGLSRVRSLTLTGSDAREFGLGELLRSPYIVALKELTLRHGRLDGLAMRQFDDARTGLRLEALDVGANLLEEAGMWHLATPPCLSELKELRIDRCEVPLAGARVLAKKAAFLDSLRILHVEHNSFGPAGLAALLECEPPLLHTLRMRDNDLFDKGAALLAESPASDGLLELDLSQNGIGTAGAQALGESEHLRNLLVLRLADNSISKSAAAGLADSPLGRRLAVLDFKDAPTRYQSDYYDEDETSF
jgi:uncharacterized protein (TIGR02996 family)